MSENITESVRVSKLAELRSKLETLDTEIVLLAEKEVLTDAEEARWDDLIAEREAVKPEHDKLELRAARVEEIKAQTYREIKGVPEFRRQRDEIYSVALSKLDTRQVRDAALRTLEDAAPDSDLASHQIDAVEKIVRKDSDHAKRLLVTETEDYRSAWHKLLSDPQAATYMTDGERVAMQRYNEYRAQSSTTTAGGFAVPVLIDPSFILTNQESDNPFLRICRVIDVNTNLWKGVSGAGVAWSFDAEGSAVSDDAVTVAQPTVGIYMARGFIPYSMEIGEDWPGFQAEMARLLAEGYDDLLRTEFTTGAGTGGPTGVITAADASTGVEVASTTDGQFGVEDLYAVWKALPQKYRRNASWLMSVDMMNKIRQFGTVTAWHSQTVQLPEGAVDALFGKPVYENDAFPDFSSTTGASNRLMVGDFSQYTIARRRGMEVELVPHLVDVTANRPTGSRGWFATARIGGNFANLGGVRLLQNQ
jgi:HK97 family phage major capsid protein